MVPVLNRGGEREHQLKNLALVKPDNGLVMQVESRKVPEGILAGRVWDVQDVAEDVENVNNGAAVKVSAFPSRRRRRRTQLKEGYERKRGERRILTPSRA